MNLQVKYFMNAGELAAFARDPVNVGLTIIEIVRDDASGKFILFYVP